MLNALKYTFYLFCFFSVNLFAQKEANIWMMPRSNGIDFNGDTISFFDGCILNNNESSSSICKKDGELLFYSNGITLYNKYHQVVKNGTNLGFPISLNETTSRQGTLLIMHPNNDSLIYLFSSDYQGRNGGLVYAVIDIYGNNDSGIVISKRNKLLGSINESITAVNHHNGRDIWILTHSFGSNFFYLFLITKNGILDCGLQQNYGVNHSKMSGVGAQVNMKFSPNGEYLTHHQLIWGNTETFRFDNKTGKIFDTIYLNKLNNVFGLEYSSNSRYLYLRTSIDSGLFQIDLVNRKRKRLLNFDDTKGPEQLQLAIDGKIYGVIFNNKDLFVIDSPNKEGDSCKVMFKKNFFLNTNVTAIPNFNQSYFFMPSINYSYEMNCIKNSIQFWGKDTFGANSHTWQARKLYGVNGYLLIGSNKDINYTFADTGNYEVRYIASNGTRTDTVVKAIVLYDKIKQDFLGKDTTYFQGDVINKTLFAPTPNHCVRWWFSKDLPPALSKGEGASIVADSVGKYICKVTNQAFCEVWDTIVINECINNLQQPSLFRSRDTLRTWHINADSFVWYRNNQLYKITKEPYLALTETGTYRVEAAKKGHCNSGSVGQLIVNRLSVLGVRIEDLGIRVFPNPSNGIISIESNQDFKFEVFDISGRIIQKGANNKVLNLLNGVYFIKFDVGGYQVTEKVVVF